MNSPNFRFLRINSSDRTQDGTTTNFKVNFLDPEVRSIQGFQVSSIVFPNLFVNFDDRFTTVSITTSTLGLLNLLIPKGQYTINEIMAEIESQLNSNLVPTITTYSVTLQPITNKIIFTRTAGLDTIIVHPHKLLGFTVIQPTSSIVIAQGLPRLGGESVVFVHSKQLNKAKSALSNDQNVSSFAAVPITAAFGSSQIYRGDHNLDEIILPTIANFSSISIKLRSEDGHVLELDSQQLVTIVLKVFY